MNEIFQSKLNLLAQDQIMIEAIKTLITERIEKEKPIIEKTDDNKILGEKYRAYENAKNILNGFFKDIESFEDKKVNPKDFNKGK